MTTAAGQRTAVRVDVNGAGTASIETGLPVLDHLIALLARYAGFDLTLQVAPESALAEVAAAGRALGEALRGALAAEDVRGHGSSVVPADEALAHVALEYSGRPLVVSNVDLSAAHIGGLDRDIVSQFLRELANGAGLTLHLRLVHGEDTQHVLAAIFKALGVALAQALQARKDSVGGA